MTNDKEILIKLLDKHIDLYKFYFEITVKINLFFYGITGAIMSYYYANKGDNEYLVFSLLIPLFFSGLLVVVFSYGARTLKPIQDEIVMISDKLDTHAIISIQSLKLFLQTSTVMFLLVFFGILFGELWR